MRKRSRKTFVSIFLIQFLFWMQAGVAQLVCQCDFSPENTSSFASLEMKPSHQCCSASASFESHETMVSSPEDEHHSCCSEQSAQQPGNNNLNYSASLHWCKTACLGLETVQTKQSLLPKANDNNPDLIPVSHPLSKSNLATAPPASLVQNYTTFSFSPPLFLLNSAFLI
jgi:hypothetical protein